MYVLFLVVWIRPAWSSLEQGRKLQHFLLDRVVAWVPDLSHRMPLLGTLVRDVWESQAKIPYWWHQNYPDLGSGSDWFLPKNTRSTRTVNMAGRKLSNETLEECPNTVSKVQNTQSARTASRCPSSWADRLDQESLSKWFTAVPDLGSFDVISTEFLPGLLLHSLRSNNNI